MSRLLLNGLRFVDLFSRPNVYNAADALLVFWRRIVWDFCFRRERVSTLFCNISLRHWPLFNGCLSHGDMDFCCIRLLLSGNRLLDLLVQYLWSVFL
jgi:hypothetical protein